MHSPPRSFLDLPAEIRNTIYHDILESTGTRGKCFRFKMFRSDLIIHALLHVCRQVRHEAGPILYHDVRVMCSPRDVIAALKRLDHRGWENISKLMISSLRNGQYNPADGESAEAALQTAHKEVEADGFQVRHDVMKVLVAIPPTIRDARVYNALVEWASDPVAVAKMTRAAM